MRQAFIKYFARLLGVDLVPRKDAKNGEIPFSRRAVDSSDIPMEAAYSVRLPYDLRVLGGRTARAKGFSSLGEYMRHLLVQDIDQGIFDDDSLYELARGNVLRNGDRRK